MKYKNKKRLRWIDWLAVTLLLAGGLNWGLIGFFNFNLVQEIFVMLAKYIYMIVGVGFVWVFFRWITKTFMKK